MGIIVIVIVLFKLSLSLTIRAVATCYQLRYVEVYDAIEANDNVQCTGFKAMK